MGMYSANRRRVAWAARHPSPPWNVNDVEKICITLGLFVFVGLPILYVANATFTYGQPHNPPLHQPEAAHRGLR